MNKILREEMEYLITCDDKAITPDVKDDVEMTLDYIDELEDRIDKAIEYIETHQLDFKRGTTTFGSERLSIQERKLLDILRGEDGDE